MIIIALCTLAACNLVQVTVLLSSIIEDRRRERRRADFLLTLQQNALN